MSLKSFFKKIILKEKSSSEALIEFLRNKGVKIGENCIIYDPQSVRIDSQNPWMLTIGNHVRITGGVQILTHDYSMSVLSSVNGNIVGSVQEVVIGNNVFIGRNAIILKGVHIGDNVIVGAGSMVSKDCESNCVYAGIPAKKICTVEEMYLRWKMNELDNAKKMAVNYFERTGKIPDEKVMREFQEIFIDREHITDSLKTLIKDSGDEKLCYEYLEKNEPQFKGLNEFLKWCGIPVIER